LCAQSGGTSHKKKKKTQGRGLGKKKGGRKQTGETPGSPHNKEQIKTAEKKTDGGEENNREKTVRWKEARIWREKKKKAKDPR